MARPRKPDGELDLDLEDLPGPARWREWMGRVEAVIFASTQPVLRESLARVVGKACNLDLIIDDIRDELSGRPYELVSVAGGWSFRTKLGFGDAIRAAMGGPQKAELSRSNALVLMGIAYFQPITRGELSQFLGREVPRDSIAALRGEGLIAAGPRSPTPGAPYAYVTTPGFLAQVREPSRPARHRETRGCGAARPDERGASRWRLPRVRVERGAGLSGAIGRSKTNPKKMRHKDGPAQPSRSITVKHEQPRWSSYWLTRGIQRFRRHPCRGVSLAN